MLLVLIRRLGSEKLTLAVTANNLDREAPRQVRVERAWPFRGERRRLRQRLDAMARAAVSQLRSAARETGEVLELLEKELGCTLA